MPLEARSTRRPGDKGTKRWLAKFGDRLLFVRYRYDSEARRMLTTVELIADQRPAPTREQPTPAVATAPAPSSAPHASLTGLRVAARERWLQQKIRSAGGYWDPKKALWILPTEAVNALRLHSRAVPFHSEWCYG